MCNNEAVTAAAHEPVCRAHFDAYAQEAAEYLPHHERTVFRQILNAGNARKQNDLAQAAPTTNSTNSNDAKS